MPADFYYGSNGERVPLRQSSRTLAIVYKGEVPEKDLEALIRGDDRLSRFIISPELSNRRMVLFRRADSAVTPIEEFALRIQESPQVEYVSRVMYRYESAVVVPDEFVAAFKPEVTLAQINRLNTTHGVRIVAPLDYAPNTYILQAPPEELAGALPMANRYFETGLTAYAEPNFISVLEPQLKPNDPLFSQQWHLTRVNAEKAWDITVGKPEVLIGILDTGIETTHEDFAGAGKIVEPIDILGGDNDPKPEAGEFHGTSVAGVAVANGNNGIGVSGMAPACGMIPVRLIGPASSAAMQGQAIRHAVDKGAAVINNSWTLVTIAPIPTPGPIAQAFDHALANGRGGKGTVVLFAAGNENHFVDTPAQDDRVIAVAAVNDKNVRSGYSNFGPEIDVCAPSSGSTSGGMGSPFPPDGSTLNIFTTDLMGPGGFNNQLVAADPAGANLNYTGTFGGTSSACPLTAGIVALMISIAPDLTRDQIKFVLEATADKVDFANTDPIGAYQPNGHSQFYGFGRVNALDAVRCARSSVPLRDFVQNFQVTMRRTTGNRFVSVKTIRTIDARRRQDETDSDIFIRGGPDGFLRAEMTGASDEVEVDA